MTDYDAVYTSKADQHVTNMVQAYVVARLRAKDPNTKVGSLVFDTRTTASFVGYNGFADKVPNYKRIWDLRDASDVGKYAWVTHSEENSIRKAHICLGHLDSCLLYVSHYPCRRCMAGSIAMSGIKKIYFADDKHYDKVSESIAQYQGIEMIHYKMPKVQLLIDGVEV